MHIPARQHGGWIDRNTHNSVGDAAAAPNADELIEAAHADTCLAINQNSQCDRVYLQTMRKFQSFVDSQRDLGMLNLFYRPKY
jgi:hypothetical protein